MWQCTNSNKCIIVTILINVTILYNKKSIHNKYVRALDIYASMRPKKGLLKGVCIIFK